MESRSKNSRVSLNLSGLKKILEERRKSQSSLGALQTFLSWGAKKSSNQGSREAVFYALIALLTQKIQSLTVETNILEMAVEIVEAIDRITRITESVKSIDTAYKTLESRPSDTVIAESSSLIREAKGIVTQAIGKVNEIEKIETEIWEKSEPTTEAVEVEKLWSDITDPMVLEKLSSLKGQMTQLFTEVKEDIDIVALVKQKLNSAVNSLTEAEFVFQVMIQSSTTVKTEPPV